VTPAPLVVLVTGLAARSFSRLESFPSLRLMLALPPLMVQIPAES